MGDGVGRAVDWSVSYELQGILNEQQATRIQHGASFRVSHKWLRETVKGECAAAGFLGPDGLALRPKVTYTVSS